jgi:hypothetical protein
MTLNLNLFKKAREDSLQKGHWYLMGNLHLEAVVTLASNNTFVMKLTTNKNCINTLFFRLKKSYKVSFKSSMFKKRKRGLYSF